MLMASFCPWGYRDMEVAIENAEEAGYTLDYVTEQVGEFMDSLGITKLEDVDVVYVVYDALHQEARTEIESATSVDICNDAPYYNVNVYGNYMCTDFDGKDEDREAIKKLIAKVENPSKVVQWLNSKMD